MKKIITGLLVGALFMIPINVFAVSKASLIADSLYFLLPPLLEKDHILTQEELVGFIKPSTVRIVERVSGTVTIPAFDIDFKSLSVSFPEKGEPARIPLDTYFLGSGFIISSEGYIITNAHVVSDEMAKASVVSQMLAQAIYIKAFTTKQEDINDSILKDPNASYEFSRNILKKVLDRSSVAISKTVTVLNPGSKKERIKEAIIDGFPAKIVKVNNRFLEDDRDVAVLKINQANLPAIQLGSSAQLTVGSKAYIFGFPSTAELGNGSLNESTFTQGVISAIKDARNKDFKMYQTDAKVSAGSSGGPLFNNDAEVIGVITAETNPGNKNQGDNFAFAIPIAVVKNFLIDTDIQNLGSEYISSFREGLRLMENRKCKLAIEKFNKAGKFNTDGFSVDSYVNPEMEKCNNIIAAGESLDTDWDFLKARFALIPAISLVILFGSVAVFFISIYIMFIFRRKLRKQEQEIDMLRKRNHK